MKICWGSMTDNLIPNTIKLPSPAETSRNYRYQKIPSYEDIIIPNLKRFTLAELKAATKNFRSDTYLGEGGFGELFKGWVSKVGIAIAVRKLNLDCIQGLEEWLSKVEFLGKISHPNLIKLLGYCSEDKQFLLVYEYMQKGSLDNHLFRKDAVESLNWEIRLKIAIGAARGLAFLHTSQKSVIYRFFKPSNILLDGAYNAKLSDFGLAKLEPNIENATIFIHGSYADLKYCLTGRLDVKSDIYGFGVVLLQMLTGLQTYDINIPTHEHNLVKWATPFLSKNRKLVEKIMDPRLKKQYPIKGACQAAELILKCIGYDRENRPSMNEVLDTLENISISKDF